MTAFRFQYTARYGQRRSAAGGGKSEAVSRKGPGWQTQSGWEPVGPTVEMRYFAMNLMGERKVGFAATSVVRKN